MFPEWFHDARALFAFADIVLCITQPGLYKVTDMVRNHLRTETELQASIEAWPTLYNGLGVISNCQTPRHHDPQTFKMWADILMTFGNYVDADLELRDVGLRLRYRSGSIVVVSGALLTHGVEASDGERVCWAYYMRDQVHEHCKVEASHWTTVSMVHLE